MKFQKLLALLLALVMVFALAACGDDAEKKENDDEKSSNSVDKDEGKKDDKNDDTNKGDDNQKEENKDENKEDNKEEEKKPEPDAPAVQSIVGSWLNVASMSGEMMGLENFDGELDIGFVLHFDEKGYYCFVSDDSVLEASLEANKDKLENATYLTYVFDEDDEMVELEFEGYDEFKEILLGDYCLPVEAAELGEWAMDGDTLTLDGEEVSMVFDGDELILSGEYMELLYGEHKVRFAKTEDLDIDLDYEEEIAPDLTDSPVVGDWLNILSMNGEMMGLDNFNGELDIGFVLRFDSDGTYSFFSDDSVLEASIEANKEALADATYWAYDFDENDELIQVVIEDYDEMKELLLVDYSFTEETSEAGEWAMDGDTLIMDGEEVSMVFDGDELILSGEYMELLYGEAEVRFTPVN